MKKTYLSALIGLLLFSSCLSNYPEIEHPIVDDSSISFITQKAIGDSISLKIIFENEADRAEAWIDLNNNGIREEGKAIEEATNYAKYKIGSQTIKIHGKVSLFYCTEEKITKLDVSKAENLVRLECFNNEIENLELSRNKELENLECDGNQLKNLDLSQNRKLKRLKCSENQLRSLDVSKNKALESLYCNSNHLKAIDLSGNTELKDFICFNNLLKELNLTNNTKLKALDADYNKLEKINISSNIELETVSCEGNHLKNLDISNNRKLKYLNLNDNQFESLDITNNKDLKGLQIYMNKISDAAKMQAIVDALPERKIEEGAKFYVKAVSTSEQNEITAEQIAVARSKKWEINDEKASTTETNSKLKRIRQRHLQN